MPSVIDIDFAIDDAHRIRNFGEALCLELRRGDEAKMSMGEVDAAVSHLVVSVARRRSVRRVVRQVDRLLICHMLYAKVSVRS